LTEAAEPFRYPEGRHGKGELKHIDGLPVLVVAGTPEEIGEQVAHLGILPAKRLMDYPRDFLRHFGAEVAWRPLLSIGEGMLPRFPIEHRRELDAMVRAGAPAGPLLAANTFFDMKRTVACSAIIVEANRSDTGAPLMARNLDFLTLGYLQEYSLVTIYRQQNKRRFAALGFPGLIGCLSGTNDAGLSLAILEVFTSSDFSKRFDPAGTPFALCARRLLEECATIQEAETLLRSMKRTCRFNLAICDRHTGAVFEVTPERVIVRRSGDGLTPCTNHFCSAELAPPIQLNFVRTCERFRELEKLKRFPTPGLRELSESLHAVSFQEHTLQTMIFEPAQLRWHLAIGSCPATASPLQTLDLAPFLREPSP
jgi:hypothetical protein